MLSRRVRLSTLVLVTIAMFDLVSTVLLLAAGFGESNPLFGTLLERAGIGAFIAAKSLFVAGPVLLLEHVRTRSPQSAEQGTWIAAASYAMLYCVHLIRLAA